MKKEIVKNLVIAATAVAVTLISGGAALAADEAGPAFGVLSLLPPLIAIALCIVTREVVPSLFLGIWLAGTMLTGWNPVTGFGKAGVALGLPAAVNIAIALAVTLVVFRMVSSPVEE